MEARRYLRHPSDIPIEYTLSGDEGAEQQPIADVGLGGLSFCTQQPLPPGQHLKLAIPSIRPDLKIEATVCWCEPQDGVYQVGIEFLKDQDRYTMRMVEQVCHIEAYRRRLLEQEGRQLTAAEAAREWIQLYAKDFPQS